MYPGDPLNTVEVCRISTHIPIENQHTFERKLPLGDVRLRRFLMRVRTISQRDSLYRPSQLLGRQLGASVLFPEIPADRLIVPRGHLERLQRKRRPQSLPHVSFPVFPRAEEGLVVFWIGKDRDALVVFGCSAEKRHPTNIDFFDCVCEGTVRLRDCFGEWVEVADDDGDRRDFLGFEVFSVRGNVACEDSCRLFIC